MRNNKFANETILDNETYWITRSGDDVFIFNKKTWEIHTLKKYKQSLGVLNTIINSDDGLTVEQKNELFKSLDEILGYILKVGRSKLNG